MVSQSTHRQAQKGEVFIAVIGVTGAGKTTFISRATGRTDLEIGHSIDSCKSNGTHHPPGAFSANTATMTGTHDVIPVTFTLDGQTVTLIDTPGFDDSDRSDADILTLVANYMATTYEQGMLLTGVIFMHPINQQRLLGSEARRNRLFKKILGENAYKRVIIATTMWNQVSQREAESRMDQRRNRSDVWGDMVKLGAEVVRHDDDSGSATAIIKSVVQFGSPVELQLQKELLEAGGQIGLTSAGKQLDEDLGAIISRLRREIDELRREGAEHSEEMSELRQKLEQRERELAVVRDSNVSIFPIANSNSSLPNSRVPAFCVVALAEAENKTRIIMRAVALAIPHVATALASSPLCVIL